MPSYTPYGDIDRPMMSGDVPVPQNDQEAIALARRSKAALDYATAQNRGAHPAVQAQFQKQRQAHVDSVALAFHKFHKANPSVLSQNIIDAMHSDPALSISHPKPPPAKV